MRDALPDFLAPLVLGGPSKLRAAGRAEGECIADGAPHSTGALANPNARGRSAAGGGWLVAIVPVRASAITIGPHNDTPQSRPPSL
jgi:hypothetical protein